MKKLIPLSISLLLMVTACKKEATPEPITKKIFWGNATYNPADILRDFSTYQSYPTILSNTGVGGDVINLQPKSTINAPSLSADKMIIGEKCYFMGIVKYSGISYMNNIDSLIIGEFTSTITMKLDSRIFNNNKTILVRGTVKLNDDNSVDIEYTDSLATVPNSVNHYKIHYTK